MILPPKWTQTQLIEDAARAKVAFRTERLEEPLEIYSQNFLAFTTVFNDVVDQIPALMTSPLDHTMIADLLSHDETRRALLYLTAPPISEDDLKTLSETSLAASTVRANPDQAVRIRDIIFKILDPHRFPWIIEDRLPSLEERASAIVASAALVAARKVETFRRNDAKDRQETKVRQLLSDLGFIEVKKRKIPTLAQAPKPGEYMGETLLAGTNADVIATLNDGRLLAIECKVSNSAVNSYKRLVHDTGGKATTWYRELGVRSVIAIAVLSGVFSPGNCETVQTDKNVTLFWDFRLDDLRDFIVRANEANPRTP